MTEAVLTYTRQTTDSVLEAARHVRAKAAPSDPKQAREEAQKALAALTRPARFDFLKGQRLTSYIDREFAWLGRKLAQGEVDDKVKDWAKGFKPERALDRWSREVDPRPIPIVGPARQAILRDLRALQSHTSRWVKLKSSAEELQARRDPVAFAFEQLSQTVLEEGDGWRRAWEEQRFACPTLVGWSILMLQQLEEAMQPQAGKEQ